ncbi:MAG TPA: hypothetical protein VF284_04760 [Rhodanobacteraceae bacterium]
MMGYTRALAERRKALGKLRGARNDLGAAVDKLIGTYQEHPVSTLAGAAGIGFILSQLRVGSGLVRAGMRIASGPAWRLVKQYVASAF